MATSLCSYCGGQVISDPDSSATVCSSCGREHSTDFFTSSSNFPPPNPSGGPSASSIVSATGDFTYHQRKRYHAESLVLELSSRLGLSSSRSDETLALISRLTGCSYGAGDWFAVLSAAASYVIARRHSLPLSLNEAAAAISADHRQISRMVLRILAFLESEQLPDFDAAAALERSIRTCPTFADLEADKKEELVLMGRFLIQCMIKWFLMTGRRPLPAVAAVAALVAEVNGVAVDIDEISKEIYATISTSRIRLKELKETFVKVARALLPWGKDVNLKNVVHNMPLMVRLMESRARSAKRRLAAGSEGFEFNLDEYLTVFSNTDNEDDSDYFRMGCEGGVSFDDMGSAEISGERLTNVYKNVLDRVADGRELGRFDNQRMRRRRTRRELEEDGLWDCWEGRLHLGKKLSLEQVLDKDVGYDALPPSFVRGIESREKRRLKIEAAKCRINQTMDPISATVLPSLQEDERLLKPTAGRKRKKREVGIKGIDWEDCIIELLLLHQVDENEIEEGQYNRLLDLHVFNSLSSLSAQG